MNTRFRTRSWLAALGALLVASTASAGFMDRSVQKKREQGAQQQESRQAAPRDRPQAHYDGKDRRQNGQREPRANQNGNDAQPPRNNHNGGDHARPPRPVPPVADARPEPPRNGNRGGREGSAWNGNTPDGGAWNGNRFDRRRADNHYTPPGRPALLNRAAPRIVHSLPMGHRSYSWNGASYYHYGPHWYRPYGTSYVVVGAPYGLFVSYLPSYYSSFWYGGVRYFHSDSTYYVYEPVRRGYVVSHSPYGDDEDDDEGQEYSTSQDEDLYVYPAQGQSEQQQSDDRYECHRWAVTETGYDPIDSDYDADRRAGYLRALTACLTGRGYSVR